MTGRLKDLTMNLDGSQNITIKVGFDFREMFDSLKDHEINVEIKKLTKQRSLDANAYFWHLCSEIAKRSSKYSTDGKDDVYREAIRSKGEYVSLKVLECAVDTFISKWAQKGTGWFADIVDDAIDYDELMGDNPRRYKIIHAYYGSSTYDTLAMSRIIDYVVLIANDLGIPTMTEKEKEKLLASWGKKRG